MHEDKRGLKDVRRKRRKKTEKKQKGKVEIIFKKVALEKITKMKIWKSKKNLEQIILIQI